MINGFEDAKVPPLDFARSCGTESLIVLKEAQRGCRCCLDEPVLWVSYGIGRHDQSLPFGDSSKLRKHNSFVPDVGKQTQCKDIID